jgi:DNA repair exonuclease SbcCD ATPase subunit
LEELVLKIGYDPSNMKVAEDMIKKKNDNIASLRKQLKFPPTEDSHAKEIAKKEGEKDEMLKLLMEQNTQLKEMEVEMEKLVKEKEQLKPIEVIPLNSIPILGVSTTSVTKVPSATPLTSLEKTANLAKSMEKMNLQETEINRLKKEIENLQELKSYFHISLSKENQVTDQLKQELQQLQKKTVTGKTLAEVKESVWIDITKSMNEIWPMI